MAFMSKEVLQSEAKRLGVDISNVSFPKAQGLVIAAQKEDGSIIKTRGNREKPHVKGVKPKDMTVLTQDEFAVLQEATSLVDKTQEEETVQAEATRPHTGLQHYKDKDGKEKRIMYQGREVYVLDDRFDKQYKGKIMLLSPEMAPTEVQPFTYEEVLGEEMAVSRQEPGNLISNLGQHKETTSGRWANKETIPGKKVYGTAAFPKYNEELSFKPQDPDELFMVVSFKGQSGYLYTHHLYPNVKATLMESGYYEEYSHKLDNTRNVFYCGGLLAVSIPVVHSIFAEIERKEAARRRGGMV
jgi:hypothetical protein